MDRKQKLNLLVGLMLSYINSPDCTDEDMNELFEMKFSEIADDTVKKMKDTHQGNFEDYTVEQLVDWIVDSFLKRDVKEEEA